MLEARKGLSIPGTVIESSKRPTVVADEGRFGRCRVIVRKVSVFGIWGHEHERSGKMTGNELLERLREELDTSGLLEDEVRLEDVLDAMGCVGLSGAGELYVELLQRANPSGG